MTEKDGSGVSGHAFVHKGTGLTVGDLRVLLTAVDTAGLPDSAELYVKTKWSGSKHGLKARKITAAVPE